MAKSGKERQAAYRARRVQELQALRNATSRNETSRNGTDKELQALRERIAWLTQARRDAEENLEKARKKIAEYNRRTIVVRKLEPDEFKLILGLLHLINIRQRQSRVLGWRSNCSTGSRVLS